MTQAVKHQEVRIQPGAPKAADLTALDLLDRIYQPATRFPQSEDPAISGHSINHGFTVADCTWMQRCLSDLFEAVKSTGASTPKLESIFRAISTPGASVAYQAFGTPSVTYSWTAILQMLEETKNIAHSERIGDRKGALLAQIARVQDATLAAGGISFAGYRATAIASAIKKTAPSGFHAPTLLGRITYCFVFIGMLFFSVYYLILATLLGVKTVQGAQFKRKLEKAEQDGDLIAFLRSRLVGELEDPLAKLQKKYGDNAQAIQEDLRKEVLSYGSEMLKRDLKTIGETRTDQERRAFLEEKLALYSPNQIHSLGLMIKARKLELKKEAKLVRLTNNACVALVRQALKSRDPADVQAAIQAIKTALDANRNMNLAVMGLCLAGAIFMLLGLVFATGVGAIVCAVAMILVCGAMIELDSDALHESLTSDEAPRKLDKMLVKVSMALCLASIATVVGLVLAGLIVASPYVLAMTVLLSLIWLAYNLKTLDAIHEKEKRFKAEHPTLETLIEALDNASDEELKQLLSKLPKELQLDLTDRKQAKEETLQIMRDIKQLQEAHLEKLRQQLATI